MDVAARENMGNVMFASGWDERSVLFHALVKGEWQRYRLPKRRMPSSRPGRPNGCGSVKSRPSAS